MIRAFEEENGSTICRELKGIDTGVMLRSCPDCIASGMKIIGEKLFNLSE